MRHSTEGTAYISLTNSTLTVNPATVSPSSKQFNRTPANTWVKLSLTFTCSESGNVTPFAHSNTGAFYVAKYNLVEGSSIFSLNDNLSAKATKEEISGIGDYKKYSFALGSSLGSYWNTYIDKEISAGDKVRFIFDSYSGNSALNYVRLEGLRSDEQYETIGRINSPIRDGNVEAYARNNYIKLRVQFARVTDESNVTGSVLIATTKNLGITNDILSMMTQKVYHVEKDGSGDFDSLVEAVQEATSHVDSIVYLGAGEWDIIDEFGETYMNAVSSTPSTWGLVLKNRIHLIGTAKTIIKAVNNSENINFENIKTYFSVFNAGEKGFILENINIEDENIRYSIHDDRGGSGPEPYMNKYICCSMIHKNGKYSDCIGAGLGENQTVEIRGCYFKGDLGRPRLVYWHGNNNSQVTDALGKITVCDNYFAQDGTFKLTNYGQSNTDTVAYVSNNSFGTAPSVNSGSSAPYTNMRIIQWNNEIRGT